MLFQELGLEALILRRWLRILCLFYKLFEEKSPAHLFRLIPEGVVLIGTTNSTPYNTRSVQKSQVPFLKKTKTNLFKNYFFPAVNVAVDVFKSSYKNKTWIEPPG